MKVLYDITVLGMGHIMPRAKTGVFRVAENLACGLKEIEECELEFCVSSIPDWLFASFDYLDANDKLNAVSFPHSWRSKRQLWSFQNRLNLQIEDSHGLRRNSLRLIRKLVSSAGQSARRNYRPIESKSISNSNIYHSPFHPIPEEIRTASHLQKFLSVMDLIPILFPDFFEFDESGTIKKAINSLDPESWIFCISHSTKEDLCNYTKLIDPSKVFVTHLAASELFYPCTNSQHFKYVCEKYKIPKSPYILSLSTLEPRKNIDHIIRCYIQLVEQEKLQDLHLVLVGTKGWKYDKIYTELSNNPILKDRIIVTGYVADEDLASLYSNALAFVYPSFYEGFGLPPLEAMQCGIPVITSDTSSLPEVVGDAGIMLNPKDVDGMCHSLLKLYSQPALRQAMARKSIEQSKKFSWEKCVQETVAAYKLALSV
ncbi:MULTISPECIES: glycosyltransferase family 4 protein [Cyanophyceae]|uniref:Glycosyltransferase family 4 protein n=1 Tax=Leptolyngbya subtilissima DQ-A4 TaxID=2933933 RepID=A0ABV0K5N6_9CYAN|nr:glycosyltransferase family 1 protein [Nodosilinea sp. FACHB-141]MBD2114429.1 glycosyltransferase family 4 protein [Nodosilinea sp. FACHB-141]